MPDLREAWIIVGPGCAPAPFADVCGMPSLLRHACALAAAGARRILVLGLAAADEPRLVRIARDPRLRGAELVAGPAPAGDGDGAVLVLRADRVMHRDLPRALVEGAPRPLRGAVRIGDLDAVVLAPRPVARWLVAGVPLAALAPASVPPPWRGFAVAAPDARALRRAEWRLLDSLRKPIDGLAARLVNRHVSLRLTRALMRTRVRPDHVTLLTMALGVAAGVTCALGGWAWAMLAVVLLELGSILDGVDGELARLRYQFSTRGEWLDTISDDLANASFIAGATVHLTRGGASWAPVAGAVALGAFAVTQAISYARLRRMGRGDLLALSWGAVSRSRWLARAALLVKRDFFVTAFVPLVAVGRLDVVLGLLSLGAVAVLLGVALPRRRGMIGAQCAPETSSPSASRSSASPARAA